MNASSPRRCAGVRARAAAPRRPVHGLDRSGRRPPVTRVRSASPARRPTQHSLEPAGRSLRQHRDRVRRRAPRALPGAARRRRRRLHAAQARRLLVPLPAGADDGSELGLPLLGHAGLDRRALALVGDQLVVRLERGQRLEAGAVGGRRIASRSSSPSSSATTSTYPPRSGAVLRVDRHTGIQQARSRAIRSTPDSVRQRPARRRQQAATSITTWSRSSRPAPLGPTPKAGSCASRPTTPSTMVSYDELVTDAPTGMNCHATFAAANPAPPIAVAAAAERRRLAGAAAARQLRLAAARHQRRARHRPRRHHLHRQPRALQLARQLRRGRQPRPDAEVGGEPARHPERRLRRHRARRRRHRRTTSSTAAPARRWASIATPA